MTSGTSGGNRFSCSSCSYRARPGDRYCERCGSPHGALLAVQHLIPENGQARVALTGQSLVSANPDLDTTRYLCAAAHLNEEFCNEAVAEFVIEPVRAIPPTPGVDSAAVLREAVAAQTRRRIRDSLLLGLLAVLVLVNYQTVIFWALVVAFAAALQARGSRRNQLAVTDVAHLLAANIGNGRRTLAGMRQLLTSDAGRRRRYFAISAVVIWILLGLLFAAISLSLVAVFGTPGFSAPQFLPGNITVTLLISALMFFIFVVDEFTVAKLMTSSFRRDRFDPDAGKAPSAWERLVRALGHESFRAELDRVARSDESSQPIEHADVVVYRGYNPFVGAGEHVKDHVIALPLEPSEDDSDTDPVPISVNDLHRHVVESLATLRSPSSLSPGRRLEQLRVREQVFIPADRLLFNRAEQMQPPVLPDLDRPPLAHLSLDAARALAEHPLEWARYYTCFRVESWDRDLAISCYLHIGTEQHMLYLEPTYCVLFPVNSYYRSIDRPADPAWTVFSRSLAELVTFPASFARRLRSVFRTKKRMAQRVGVVVPDRYGAQWSLRELAADTEAQTYFQDVDVERYINVIDRALFRAVGKFLEQRGYSVVEFTKIAERVVNNSYTIQGNVNSFIGSGNKNVRVDATRVGSVNAKGAK